MKVKTMFRRFSQQSQSATRLIALASQMPPPLSAFSLCRVAEGVLQRKINTFPDPQLSPKVPGIVARFDNGDVEIVYRPSFHSLSLEISILHELAHLLLGHCPKKSVRLLEEKVYTSPEERQAEWLALHLMDFLVKYRERPILTRFLHLISPFPAVPPLEKPDPRLALRFRALIEN